MRIKTTLYILFFTITISLILFFLILRNTKSTTSSYQDVVISKSYTDITQKKSFKRDSWIKEMSNLKNNIFLLPTTHFFIRANKFKISNPCQINIKESSEKILHCIVKYIDNNNYIYKVVDRYNKTKILYKCDKSKKKSLLKEINRCKIK